MVLLQYAVECVVKRLGGAHERVEAMMGMFVSKNDSARLNKRRAQMLHSAAGGFFSLGGSAVAVQLVIAAQFAHCVGHRALQTLCIMTCSRCNM